jgi:hypothetical protein
LHRGPWKVLDSYEYAPGSRKTPWKLWIPCNVVLGGGGGCRRWNSGEGRRRGQPGTGAGWSRGALGPIWEVGPGGEVAGDGRRRRTQVAATVVRVPARWRLRGVGERNG